VRELAGNETSTRDSSCQPRAFVLSNDFRLHDLCSPSLLPPYFISSPIADPLPLLVLFVHDGICVLRKHIGIHPISIIGIAAKKRIRINRGLGTQDSIFARLLLSKCRLLLVEMTSREANICNDQTINNAGQNPENIVIYYYVFIVTWGLHTIGEPCKNKAKDETDSRQ